MSNIWISSDPHWNHANISGPKVSQWKDGYRNFDTVEQMNQAIVKAWNRVVKDDDELWVLGDWSFGGLDNVWNFRKQLRCENIHLVLGNHDHHIEKNKILPNVVSYEPIGLMDKPLNNTKSILEDEVTAKLLFSSVQHYKELKVNNRTFVLFHYSLRVWLGSHKGYYHCYGHSHNSLEQEPYGKSMDVGIDSAYARYKEYRPFHINEVIEILDKRPIVFCDHHNSETNVH